MSAAPATVLGELQRWMQGELARPASAPRSGADVRAIEREIRPSASLDAVARLDVYTEMVRLRLVDCLRQDYGGLCHALGEREFEHLALAYLERYPSSHFSLNVLGQRLPEFLRSSRPRQRFLAQLADLEAAVQEVFDSAPESSLGADEVLSIAPVRWPALRLRTSRSLRLLESDYPVQRYLQAVYDQRHPPRPVRARAWTAVYRKDFVVWRAELDRERWTILSALREGATVTAAIERALKRRGADRERIARELGGWFQEWAAEGWFSAAVEDPVEDH